MAPVVDDPIITTAQREFYERYLASVDWRMRRNRALQQAGWKCNRCPSKRGLEVHHRTYDRLGREWDSDLEVVCGACHGRHHLEEFARGNDGRVYLKIVRLVHAAEPFASLADLSEDAKRLCATHRVPYDAGRIGRALELVLQADRTAQPAPLRLTSGEVVHEPKPFADPCGCRLCTEAGVSDRRIRLDPRSGEWLHGEQLRRWYAAREAFQGLIREAGFATALAGAFQ